jgi:serine protease Do
MNRSREKVAVDQAAEARLRTFIHGVIEIVKKETVMKSCHRTHWFWVTLLTACVSLGAWKIGSMASASTTARNAATKTPVTFKVATPPEVGEQEAAESMAAAQSLSMAFRVAAQGALPAVVAIETRSKPSQVPATSMEQMPQNPFSGTPFEDFFRQGVPGPMGPGGMRPQVRPGQSQQAIGSGVIIDARGLILTNNHVVEGGDEVVVRLGDGREYRAARVLTDPKTDVAIIELADASDLPTAMFADSDQVSIGDWVLALGQPFGLESTVTAGIISAKHRGIGINARENYLQTDAAINPGNSGGPLVDLHGNIIGINTAISSRGGGNDGIGFAIPANDARWIAEQLLNHGTVKRSYLGVGIQMVDSDLAKQFGVNPKGGVLVTRVMEDSPADKAGVKTGDVITRYAGVDVHSPRELQLFVERSEAGLAHEMEVMRGGESKVLTFVPELQDAADVQSVESGSGSGMSGALGSLGVELQPLSDSLAKELGLDSAEGVAITQVAPGSVAAQAGMQAGMVIREVNQIPVQSIAEVQEAMEKNDKQVLLLMEYQGSRRFVVLDRNF